MTIETKSDDSPVLEWEKDPRKPSNWPLYKKIYNTAVPALLCFGITFGLSIYTPVHTEVQQVFGVSATKSLLPYALYVYGLAFGPIISAPLSETYGRRWIYIVATPISYLFTLGAGFSNNFASLVVCRFLAGTLGSSPLAVGAGTIADLWSGRHSARAISLLFLTSLLGPTLGPVVGSYVAAYKDWRWTQWCILFLGTATWIFSFGAQETYSKVILRTQAKRLGLPLPPNSVPSGLAGLRYLAMVTFTRPVLMLVTDPIVGLFSLYTSFNFSMLFCFLAAFPPIFQSTYDFPTGQSGLVFVGVAIGCSVGAVVIILIDLHIYQRRMARKADGVIAPEQRLWAAMIGSIIMPMSLFWFAWTARPNVHWMVPIIAGAFFGCASIMIFAAVVLYLTDVYGAASGASAMAANGLLRYTMGGSFPLFTPALYNNLGTAWATSLLAFLSTAFLPLPWLFYRFGTRLRKPQEQ